MDSDFIERLQCINLTSEEGEVITVQFVQITVRRFLRNATSVLLADSLQQNPSIIVRQRIF